MIAWIDGWLGALGPGMLSLLTVSWQASVLVVIVLAVQAAFGRWLSARWRYALWSVVVLRLVLPVTPGSAVSVFNLFRGDPGSGSEVMVAELPAGSVAEPMEAFDLSGFDAVAYAAGGESAEPINPWSLAEVVLVVWLAGASLVLGMLLLINFLLALRLRRGAVLNDPGVLEMVEACKREMGVRRGIRLVILPGAGVASPALAGVFRPTLLIPPGLLDELPREELRFVLLHELAHVKKHDIAMNWLLIALSALHWLNPLVWFAFSRLRADRELARDAMVLRATGTDASQAYGQTIIHILERLTRPRLNNPALAGIGDGMGQLKRRLRMIALSPKRRPALTVVGAVLLATLTAIGLTDAAERGAAEEAPETSADDVWVEQKLKQSIRVDFDNTPLKDVVQAVHDQLSVPVFVNWPKLADAGLGPDSPVTLRASMPGDQILNLVFQGLSLVGEYKGYNRPAFRIIDGVVTISTERDLMIIETRVYDIRDLLVQVPDFEPEPLGPRVAGATLERTAKVGPSREAMVGQITELIRKTVGSYDEWKARGGDLSSIDELNGNLVIVTSRENHANILGLLAQLREVRSPQISIEARFLFLTEQFANESGIGKPFSGLPEDQRVQFLDDIETDLIIKSTRDSTSAALLVMPRTTLSNGQKAYVTMQQQSAYVSGFKQTDGGQGATYEPLTHTINEGVLLQIQAWAIDGGRRVSLALHPTVLNLRHPIKKRRWEDAPPDQDLLVELPEYTQAEVETKVSMLDKSTVMMDVGTMTGPMKGVRDVVDPVEEGVERRVYVLVKPTIIPAQVEAAGVED